MGEITIRDPLNPGRTIQAMIAGDTPTPQESAGIARALQSRQPAPQGPVPVNPQAPIESAQPSARERFSRRFRNPAIGLGGAAGSAAGAALGFGAGGPPGAVAGLLKGGAAGAAGTSLLFDAIEGRENIPGGVDLEQLLFTTEPQKAFQRGANEGAITRAINEASLDIAIPGGISQVRPGLAALKRRLIGGGEEGLALARGTAATAAELKQPIGIEDVSSVKSVTGFREIFGKFPFLGTAFQRADEARQAAFQAARQNDEFFTFGPHISSAEAGIDVVAGAKNTRNQLKAVGDDLYRTALNAARTTGAKLHPTNLRAAAADLIETTRAGRPRMTMIAEDGTETLIELPVAVANKVTPFASNLAKLADEPISLDQYRALMKDIDDIINVSRNQGLAFRDVAELRKALERDLVNIDNPAVRDLFLKANTFFGQTMDLLSTVTSKKFGRADKNIFSFGFSDAGTKNIDQMFEVVYNAKSAKGMDELFKLVGRPVFRRATQTHIDNAIEQAITRTRQNQQLLNVDFLKESLGLARKGDPRGEALAVALGKIGGDIVDVRRMVDFLDSVAKGGVIDVSKFATRRAILGGPSTLVRTFVPTAALSGGSGALGGLLGGAPVASLAAVMSVVGIRQFGKLITDPAALKSALKVVEPNLSQMARDAAIARFGKVAAQQGLTSVTEEFEQRSKSISDRLSGRVFQPQGTGGFQP
jgi:hypothetical protein